MKYQLKWILLLSLFAAAVGVYMGCATITMSQVAYGGEGHTRKSLVLTDEIIAIGKPDASLAKELNKNDCIAFIGKEHTYMLFTGGEELWQIAQLKLDANRMEVDTAASKHMYLDNNRVWGEITVTYDGTKAISPEERSELLKTGFVSDNNPIAAKYRKTISISGLVYPAIKVPDGQMPQLKRHRVIKFYAEKYSGPSVTGKILKTPLVVVGVAVDTVLLPVYILGITVAVISH